jgi:TetR/AcrR family transcriptional regulator, transcriptional repressor for nem operon
MNTTRERLLDLARDLMQNRGYAGFSYRDLADATQITTASIHYHFPSKADLGAAVVARHRATLATHLAMLQESLESERRKILAFTDLFRETLKQENRMCLCGMLAAEQATLPEAMHQEVLQFFALSEQWLKERILAGVKKGEWPAVPNAARLARRFVALLEGAMLLARVQGEPKRLQEATEDVISFLT